MPRSSTLDKQPGIAVQMDRARLPMIGVNAGSGHVVLVVSGCDNPPGFNFVPRSLIPATESGCCTPLQPSARRATLAVGS
jgi:hypothetical protein